MPAIYFKPHLAALVTAGCKTHTIRKWRQRPFNVGDPLMLYTGFRSPACQKIRADTNCTAATEIAIYPKRSEVKLANGSRYGETAGRYLTPEELDRLAREDGFANADVFFKFFLDTHGSELRGQLVEWSATP